jgi:hypothetical protein
MMDVDDGCCTGPEQFWSDRVSNLAKVRLTLGMGPSSKEAQCRAQAHVAATWMAVQNE